MQSYQNVSNSQLVCKLDCLFICCKRLCKVIKMLAIHNLMPSIKSSTLVANAFAKLSKCQQFTTQWQFEFADVQLQTLMQSYQNVSNSQQIFCHFKILNCCKRFCKVIKMLAIHNCCQLHFQPLLVANAFAKLSKCQQFTTAVYRLTALYQLQTLLQSYQNVSNSQLL